ncbi:MAG TPA: hypothetical protein DGT23_05400 [Micromonosporaceae bacterium]|nr:hypothetical protein [Micromonosporaceae bacterium]
MPAPPGPPAFVTPTNVAPVVPVTEQDHDTDAPQGALVESTSEIPLVSNPYAQSTSDDEPVAEAEAIVVEAAAEAPAETDAAQAIEEAQAELEEAATEIEEAKADLDEADSELGQATAELEEAEEELAVVEEVVEDTVTEAPAAEAATEEAATEEAVAEEVYEEEDEYSDDFSDEDDDVAEQLRPGDVEETVIAIWDPEVAERYRDAWRDIQAHFVDEPEAALGEAQDLVAEAVQALADALLAEQVSLDPHEQDATPDTEAMRIAMRGYRDFLERVLAL